MTRRVCAALIACIACIASLAAGAVPAAAATPRVAIGAGVRGPSTLDATVYAKKLRHVAALTEDAEGRIWAATTAADGDDGDAVYVIDGARAKPRRVIDDVDTPLGLVWLDDALYVSRAAGVDRYSGFDGSTFSARTTVLALPGDVGLVQGLTVGADGRLVVGVAAPCDSCTPDSPWSAAVVSVLPDGGDARVVASGIRSAVGLAHLPGTDDLFVTMNQRDDLGGATPGDWLAVVEAGQTWGFPDCHGQATAACAGLPGPVAVLGEHAALSGVGIVTGQLGAAVGTGAVVAEWATGKVKLVSLTPTGDGGYDGTTTTLLTGLDHPMPVLVTSDGAVLVGDWQTGRIVRLTGS